MNSTVEDVASLYNSPEGDLFELAFGEQIHIGGLNASIELAQKANIRAGMSGVDLCCCNGASMRFLVEQLHVSSMTGVDISDRVIEIGEQRCASRGLSDQVRFVQADACDSGLPSECVDFVWSEDAWVYVDDKKKLISEAVRLVKFDGTIAFTDWVTGAAGITPEESTLLQYGLHTPNLQTLAGYCQLLEGAGCTILVSEETGLFAPQMSLIAEMLATQYKYDAQQLVPENPGRVDEFVAGLAMLADMARMDKITQVRIVARKTSAA
jgi:sarcosine/dimethylglycine N-methyltransferase